MDEGIENPNNDQAAPQVPESGGWGWGGFFSNLSTQAASLVEEYVSDIKEFGSTISHDTTEAIESVAHKVEEVVSTTSSQSVIAPISSIKTGVSSFVSGMSEMAHGVAQELGEIRSISASPSASVSGLSAAQLQEKLTSTDEVEFTKWLTSFDMESKKTEISHLLAHNTTVLSLFQELVPNDLSQEEFWGRYFFKMDQAIKKEEQRAAILLKTKLMASKLSESEFSWDDDEPEDKKEEVVSSSPNLDVLPHHEPSVAAPSTQPTDAKETDTDAFKSSEEGGDEATSPSSIIEPPTSKETSKETTVAHKEPKSVAEEGDVFEWS